jgi:hypothetical protein
MGRRDRRRKRLRPGHGRNAKPTGDRFAYIWWPPTRYDEQPLVCFGLQRCTPTHGYRRPHSSAPPQASEAHENGPTCAQFKGPTECAAEGCFSSGGAGEAGAKRGRLFALMGMAALLLVLGGAERSPPEARRGHAFWRAGVEGESADQARIVFAHDEAPSRGALPVLG